MLDSPSDAGACDCSVSWLTPIPVRLRMLKKVFRYFGPRILRLYFLCVLGSLLVWNLLVWTSGVPQHLIPIPQWKATLIIIVLPLMLFMLSLIQFFIQFVTISTTHANLLGGTQARIPARDILGIKTRIGPKGMTVIRVVYMHEDKCKKRYRWAPRRVNHKRLDQVVRLLSDSTRDHA